MMRNEQSQQHRFSQGREGGMGASQSMQSSTDNVLQSIMKKESQYCDGIKMNHSILKSMTQRLCDIQSLLALNDGDAATSATSQSPNEKKNEVFQNAINDQKQIIRNIAKENVFREQYVRTFCDTLKSVRTKQQKEPSQQAASTNNDGVLSFDYQKAILEGIDSLSRKRNIDQEELLQQEQYYRDIADLLGDPKPTTTSAHPNKQRRSGGKGNSRINDDDDDDIEMTAPTGGVNQIQQLKCPITRGFMTDAVENTVCHHIYSREGIMSYLEQNLRNRPQITCPIAGCINKDIKATQLQDNHDISMMSKREIRRQDMRKEQQQMSANDVLMDSDEE